MSDELDKSVWEAAINSAEEDAEDVINGCCGFSFDVVNATTGSINIESMFATTSGDNTKWSLQISGDNKKQDKNNPLLLYISGFSLGVIFALFLIFGYI